MEVSYATHIIYVINTTHMIQMNHGTMPLSHITPMGSERAMSLLEALPTSVSHVPHVIESCHARAFSGGNEYSQGIGGEDEARDTHQKGIPYTSVVHVTCVIESCHVTPVRSKGATKIAKALLVNMSYVTHITESRHTYT